MKIAKIAEFPMFRTKIKTDDVKLLEMILGYFVAPFGAMISNAIFAAYLNRYYVDVLGWTKFGTFATLLPIVSVIFVVAGNMLVGRLIDNTRTTQGKARPYLLLSAPLVVVSIALLFMTPINGNGIVQMIWIALSYNLYYAVAYPVFYTAHSSMVALSTRNTKQRGLLSTMSNAAMVASAGLGASIVVPVLLQSYLFVEDGNSLDVAASYSHWRIVALVLCVLSFLSILCEYYFTRERITEENLKLNITEEKLPLSTQLKGCVKNKYWWMIIVYFFLFQLGGLVKNSSMSFYARWMFDGVATEAQAGAVMSTLGLIGGIPTAIGMIVAFPIANKLGKKNAVVGGLALAVVGGLVSFLNIHSLPIVCVGIVLKGIGTIPASYVTLALLSDVLDHLEAQNGFRSDGFTMSVYGAIMVGLNGLGTGIINGLLTATGYNSVATVQPAAVQNVLAFTFLGLELICFAVIVVFMSFLKVEKHIEEDHKTILKRQKESVLASGGVWEEKETEES